jgi:hypothetical protein
MRTTKIVLELLKTEPKTSEQIRSELGISRDAANNAIKQLRATNKICIVKYDKTRTRPLAYFGLGSVDVNKPPTQTKEEKNKRRRERKRLEREALNKSEVIIVQRDIAASWF